jgi:DNA-3-methyladenine glycosylase I
MEEGPETRAGRYHRPIVVERCGWVGTDAAYVRYHDEEWGVPSHDERHLFEMMTLEGAQAGLSWSTILNKRDGYRRAFAGFDPGRVARFDARKVERLLLDPGIVRNRAKVASTVSNARAVLRLHDVDGSDLDRCLWSFVDGRPVQNGFTSVGEIPAQTPVSNAMSRELKRLGFRFMGPTTCYALMQTVGMVNDHVAHCFRHDEVARLK